MPASLPPNQPKLAWIVNHWLIRSLIVLCAMLGASQQVRSEPISWMEKFALSVDREATLSELIPGSDEYYFYHCLYYQSIGQLERSEAMIRDWLGEHKGKETTGITAMIDRQRLLTYRDSPQRSIDHLVARLGIKLDHAPPATKNERRFPSQVNAELLGTDRVVNDALRRNDTLKPLALQYLAERFRTGDTAGLPISLGDLLQRIDGPYIDRLDELVIKELASRRPNEQKFGDRRAHSQLTLDQLRAIGKALPKIADDNAYVAEVVGRMRPGADSDPSSHAEARFEYLQRVEAFVRALPQSYNSMKASAAYRLLEENLRRGEFDRDLFVRYLQLPRSSPLVREEWSRRGGTRANLGEDFMKLALLPPIGNEEPLVRAHLEHFFLRAANPDAFANYLKPDYLRRVFAETKLLGGVGDDQQWYKMLTASQRKEVRDRVELRLSDQNPTSFATDQPTSLEIDVKNVQELVVRIYQLNPASYYRTHEKPIDTDIDLDGLIATTEQTLQFDQPAVERHRERIDLPDVQGRGIWIVDLVGKGLRARALIRRGNIDHVDSLSADGMVFTVIDENRQPIPTATMLVGSREFSADEQGRIVLPPVVDAVSRRAIISDGVIAKQVKFQHLRERYRLEAGIYLDRTLLQSGGLAELLIRPRLMMGQTPIDPNELTDVLVRIEATDLDGLPITHQIDGLELDQNAELVVPIRVPPRLATLRAVVSGKIAGLADSQQKTLQADRSWDVGGVRRTSQVHDALLTRDGENYVIEVRGRNGERVVKGTVTLSLTTSLCNASIDMMLQADERGRVELGALPSVTHLRFSVPGGLLHHHDLELNRVRWPSEIHTTVEQPVRLPLADPSISVRERYRLYELREGRYVTDFSDQLSSKQGLLEIAPIPAGDFHLLDRATAAKTLVVVVDGPVIDRVAVGESRHREMSHQVPLSIASVTRNEDAIKVQLSGSTATARVHLYASRFLDSVTPMQQLSLPFPGLLGRRVAIPHAGYVSDLRLGDEYQYVLRRRYAKKYPGVMLPQPGVILNPWETEETSNASQSARDGEAPPPTMDMAEPSDRMMSKSESAARSAVGSSDFDFLADAGLFLANLRPDENGVVTIPLDEIGDLPIIQVVACDATTVVQRTLPSPLTDADSLDLRLAKSLDPALSLSLERAVSVVGPDRPLDLKSLGSAQLQVYASVSDLFKLYKTMVADARLNDYDVLAVWQSLDREAKLEAYSRLASHELHLFLWFHDQGFFRDVVQPYLANKKEKQFIDRWLLEQDLLPYTRVWSYSKLNAVERTLLGMRVSDLRARVLRDLRETVESQTTDVDQIRRGVEIALQSRRFDDQMREYMFESEVEELGESETVQNWQALGERRVPLSASRGLNKKSAAIAGKTLERGGTRRYLGRTSGGAMGGGGFGGKAFFRELDTTKQWAESNWDRVRNVGGPSPASLVSINAFWADIAAAEADAMEISSHLLLPTENRHAALAALAMCGLPLSAGEVGLPTDGEQLYKPEHAVAVVTKRLRELTPAEQQASILIGQRFETVDADENARGDEESNTELDEFLVGTAYQGQVVVSNPTAAEKTVEVFWQIPAGSLPLAVHQRTDSRTLTIAPFAVQSVPYQFYFPEAGEFTHYPATVSFNGQLIAKAAPKTFEVVAEPTKRSVLLWARVANMGTAAEIAAFLERANLRKIDWIRVAHRMRDDDVYRVVTKALLEANLPVTELWAYGFAHKDDAAMRIYLSLREDLVARVGPVLQSPLLDVDPIERRTHELLEYAPLVRARIHRLGQREEILNPTFYAQYESFARVLGYRADITPPERLVLTYYLLIQNRISEAIDQFDRIDRQAVESKLQYDYLDAYLAMHRGQYDRARQIARRHADHPVERWQTRFGELVSQLDQRRLLTDTEKLVSVDQEKEPSVIKEGSGDLSLMDRERRQASAAKTQPEVILQIDGDTLRIDHRNADEATIHFYGVDLELLFSKAPFVRENLQRMAMVRPTQSKGVSFDGSNGVAHVDLDGNLRRQTLLVEVTAGASRSTSLYYGGDLTTYVSESFGQLQTTDTATRRPIEGAYVKVYAKHPNGEVRFHKDGYTDLRGRFDYASVSAAAAQGATRFAILVKSEEQGATLHEVAAPNQ